MSTALGDDINTTLCMHWHVLIPADQLFLKLCI